MMGRGALLLCAGLLPVACGGGAPGLVRTPVPAASEARASGSASAPTVPVVVVGERHATATALALVLPGSGWEDDGTSGITLLAARSIVADATPALAELGARAEVSCGRWAMVLTVLSPAETWRQAADVVISGLAASAPTAEAVERARRALSASLSLDVSNPAWQASLAAGRALYATGARSSAWARPGCGVVETLSLFEATDVTGAAVRLRSIGAAAVVGAPDSTAEPWLEARLRTFGPGGGEAFPLPGAPAPGRVYVERNTITAWVAVTWPFGPGVDPETVGLIGALLEEALAPGVSRPDVLHAAASVDVHGAGGSLTVMLVAAPERAEELATLLEAEAELLARSGPHPLVLYRVARRYRGGRLLGLATPEARAARLAVMLARGSPTGPWPAALPGGHRGIRETAGALGAPARAVVGPRPARGAVVP